VVDGQRVYAADGRGVTLYDVSNPALIRVSAVFETKRPSSFLTRALDGIAVLSTDHIDLLDSELNLRDGVDVKARRIAGIGDTLVSAGDALTLWSVSGGRLHALTSVPLMTRVNALAIQGTKVFLSQNESFTEVYETDGSSLRRTATLPLAAASFVEADGRLYAISAGNVTAVDTSGATPQIVGRLTFSDSLFHAGTIIGKTLFVIDRFTSLVAIDISDPANLRQISSIPGPVGAVDSSGERLFTAELLLDQNSFTAETSQPLTIYDVGPGPALQKLGAFHDYAGPLGGVAISGRYAFVADAPMFRVLNIGDVRRPREIASMYLGDFSDRLLLRGSTVLVYGRGKVHMIDVTSPVAPRQLGVFRSGGIPRSGAAWAGEYLLEANKATGFHVVDVSDPTHPVQTTGLKNDSTGFPTGVLAGIEGAAYIGVSSDGLKVADLTDPHHDFTSSIIPGSFTDAKIIAATASHPPLLALVDLAALRLFDLSKPAVPVEISSLPISGRGTATVQGDLVYIASLAGDLTIVSVADPSQPRILFSAGGLNTPVQISADGGRIAVADTYSLKIFSDPLGSTVSSVVLSSSSPDPGSVVLGWTGGVGPYEVQTSPDESFAAPTSVLVSGSMTTLPLQSVAFVRVRRVSSCSDSGVSNVLRIDPGDASRPFFVGSGETIYRSGTAPFTTEIAIGNKSGRDVELALTGSPAGVLRVGPVSVPAHSTRRAIVTIDPAGMTGSSAITVGSSSISGEYRIDVRAVTVTALGGRDAGSRLLIPGVGAVRGGNGTQWESDVRILCKRKECAMTLDYVPFGDGSGARRVEMTVAEGAIAVAHDVVRALFGSDDTNGFLEVRSPSLDDMSASATTLNRGGTGTYGERIPARRLQPAIAMDGRQLLPGIRQDADARTNVGIIETAGSSQTLLLELLKTDGSVETSVSLQLAAFQSLQASLNGLFPELKGEFTGILRITGPQSVVLYASRVDQKTGDFVFTYARHFGDEAAIPGDDSVRFLPAAGSTPGANNSLWRTALQLTNVSGATGTFLLTFVPSTDASTAVTHMLELAPFASADEDDLIAAYFPSLSPALRANGSVRIESAVPFIGWSRIYNQSAKGTFGQAVPLLDRSPARTAAASRNNEKRAPLASEEPAPADRAQLFALSENAAHRTNLGLLETAGKSADVAIRFFDRNGMLLCSIERHVAPGSSLTLIGALRSVGLDASDEIRGELEQTGGEGSVTLYGSVVDQETGDGVFAVAE